MMSSSQLMATTAKGYERKPMVVGIGDVDFAKYRQHEGDWGRDYDDQSTQVVRPRLERIRAQTFAGVQVGPFCRPSVSPTAKTDSLLLGANSLKDFILFAFIWCRLQDSNL
jgi:hypothetical protein